MHKKIALVKLIRNSFILPNEDKLTLLGMIETMSAEDVEAMGKFLAAEHEFILQNEKGLRTGVGEFMETLKNWKPDAPKKEEVRGPDRVYIGTGKPIV